MEAKVIFHTCEWGTYKGSKDCKGCKEKGSKKWKLK